MFKKFFDFWCVCVCPWWLEENLWELVLFLSVDDSGIRLAQQGPGLAKLSCRFSLSILKGALESYYFFMISFAILWVILFSYWKLYSLDPGVVSHVFILAPGRQRREAPGLVYIACSRTGRDTWRDSNNSNKQIPPKPKPNNQTKNYVD